MTRSSNKQTSSIWHLAWFGCKWEYNTIRRSHNNFQWYVECQGKSGRSSRGIDSIKNYPEQVTYRWYNVQSKSPGNNVQPITLLLGQLIDWRILSIYIYISLLPTNTNTLHCVMILSHMISNLYHHLSNGYLYYLTASK